jgi:hypothetical protein
VTRTRLTSGAVAVAATAALGAAATPALAAHDNNPSAKVESYSYALGAVQPASVPNSVASGTTRIKTLANGKVQVKVNATGLAPGLPHAMHLHGFAGERTDQGCPGPAQAGDDGVVSVVDGVPFYGGILTSLTTRGDTSPDSALALDRFPVASESGEISYSRTFRDAAAASEAGTVQVVVHGIDFDDNGAYAFNPEDEFASRGSSLNGDIPLEATVPVLCGGIAN